ncbi:MAG: hypothetical protein D0530_00915 [Methylococcales bacterium]|nr:MAG: hypothetical protein D0530_00915 [Methylococcales bacterium]
MNTDTKLRKSFQELQEADARQAPAFRRVIQPPEPADTLPWWRWAMGATVLASLIVLLMIKPQPAVDSQPWSALSNWSATTDELLTVANTPWGNTLSTPTDSWIENSTQTNPKETL